MNVLNVLFLLGGVIEKIVEAAGIQRSEAVYEVGCGTGELTMRLLRSARKVYTVDLEPRMVEETRSRAESAGFSSLEAASTPFGIDLNHDRNR